MNNTARISSIHARVKTRRSGSLIFRFHYTECSKVAYRLASAIAGNENDKYARLKGDVPMEELFIYVWVIIFLSILSTVFGDWVWYFFPFW